MIRALIILLIAVSSGSASAYGNDPQPDRRQFIGRQYGATVLGVRDGDTLDVNLVGETDTFRVRLEGIDAPDLNDVFHREAVDFVSKLVLDGSVRVLIRDVDLDGNLVARVTVNRGKVNVGAELLRAGLACHAYRFDKALAAEEAAARDAGAGFWSAPKKPQCVTRTAFSRKSGRQ